jgi:hypothetical protein
VNRAQTRILEDIGTPAQADVVQELIASQKFLLEQMSLLQQVTCFGGLIDSVLTEGPQKSV